jgi:hypothetical protein
MSVESGLISGEEDMTMADGISEGWDRKTFLIFLILVLLLATEEA